MRNARPCLCICPYTHTHTHTHTHTGSGPHCVALYEFATSSADELSLAIGDTVELLERVGAEWLRGRLRGQVGIFPSQFVEIKGDLPAEATGREDVEGGLSKALFDFNGQEGELSFKVNKYL